MKKIALVLVAAMVLVFTGCEKKETISMPFDVADVNNIEMYRNVVPNSAEKQVITKTDDIEDIYFLFSGLEVSDKKTEPVAGGTVTSFRFNLSNDTSYEIIYCAEAVKSGRLKLPEEKLDYFTAADIESYWDNYQYEIVPVSENELPGQEETQEWCSKLVGTYDKKKVSSNYNADILGVGKGQGTSSSTEEKRIIKPEEFAYLKDVVCVFPNGYKRLQKANYYEDKTFTDRM